MDDAKPAKLRHHDNGSEMPSLEKYNRFGAHIALAHGLDANLVHCGRRHAPDSKSHARTIATMFMPLAIEPPAPTVIHIGLQRGLRAPSTAVSLAQCRSLR